jgi:hypothetical protein
MVVEHIVCVFHIGVTTGQFRGKRRRQCMAMTCTFWALEFQGTEGIGSGGASERFA